MQRSIPSLPLATLLLGAGSGALAHGDKPHGAPAVLKKEQKPWGIAGDAGEIDLAFLGLRARRNGYHAHATSAAQRQRALLLFDQTHDLGTHGAEPRNPHSERSDHLLFDLPDKLAPVGERNHVVQCFNASFKEAADISGRLTDALLVFHHRDADKTFTVLAEA